MTTHAGGLHCSSPDDLFAVLQNAAREAHRVPVSTYRIQLNGGFTLRDTIALIPYLGRLGIGALYLSPFLKARPGSSHGYDVCDHNAFNPDVGNEDDYRALAAIAEQHGLMIIADVVPNHVGVGYGANPWWHDVLENGPSARFAQFFDIDWQPIKRELANKVLIPILGDAYGQVLERGEIRLIRDRGGFHARYFDHILPIAPGTYDSILDVALSCLSGASPDEREELESISTAVRYLPARDELDQDRVQERYRESAVIQRRLARLHDTSPQVQRALDQAIVEINGRPGDSRSFDQLDRILDRQAYRLAYWRVAAEEINYRRFFDVNDLAAIRMEQPEVFDAAHQLVGRLLAEDLIHGLRIDHPDGLFDPAGYFWRLQRLRFDQLGHRLFGERWLTFRDAVLARFDRDTVGWTRRAGDSFGVRPLFVVAEKIIEPGERLPNDWPVDGTTGYDALNDLNGLFVDARSRRTLDRIYAEFVGPMPNYHELVNVTKKRIMLVSLSSEINVLAHAVDTLSERHRWTRDFTLNTLTFALREVIAALPVYRTYIDPAAGEATARDRDFIQQAVAEAKRRNPRTLAAVFDFFADLLLNRNLPGLSEADQLERARFVRKFQQTTGPVMAKGVEDTAFYVFNRLVSLNEVGGDPTRVGLAPAEYHRRNSARLKAMPGSLVATSTHDNKRSEDTRARINVISEIPELWEAAITRWRERAEVYRSVVDELPAPDRNDEYLLYQTLVGTWPVGQGCPPSPEYQERIAAYLDKAVKEAKERTSWIAPNEPYDSALRRFVLAVLNDARLCEAISDFVKPIAQAAALSSAAQVLLKCGSPGVSDFYQGCEIPDFSLVDPDNRRPIDVRTLTATMAAVSTGFERTRDWIGQLSRRPLDPQFKMFVTWKALTARRDDPALFLEGEYHPIRVDGPMARNVIAFARSIGPRGNRRFALVAAPRLIARISGGALPLDQSLWGETSLVLPSELGRRELQHALTGETIKPVRLGGRWSLRVSAIFSRFPLALLTYPSRTG